MVERTLLKYRLLEEVGHGGMAVVYRGMDTSLNREVAIKILHAHLAEQEESRQRFQREAHAVAKLRHDNIIEIYDYSGLDSDESFIVTEFIHGQTLKEYLARNPISHPEIAAMIIVEVCHALGHAHSVGVIHRDIKPENIMIRDDGRVKLTDFGIAQVIDVQRLTVTGQLLGSPAYMAPELVEGKRIDFRADVFSVGVLLYQLATSELPFKGKNPHEVLKRISDGRYVDPEVANPVVGAHLARIIRKALAHDAEDRYHDVKRLEEDLSSYLADVDITDPRAELSAYFTAPANYSRALHARVVSRLTERGKASLQSRKTVQALEYFNRILCVDPANREVLDLLGRITRRRRVWRVVAMVMLAGTMSAAAYLVASRWPAAPAVQAPDARRAVRSSDAKVAHDSTPTRPRDSGPGHASKDSDTRMRIIRSIRTNPALLRRVEIIPTPKAVGIWLNGRRLGDYGPDLRQLALPPNAPIKLVFRNDTCCFEQAVELGPRDNPGVLRVKLPWKPARLQVVVSPTVPADVQVGSLVARPGQAVEVPIPAYSDNGQDEVEIKVSAAGYDTVTRRVKIRANTTKTESILLRRNP